MALSLGECISQAEFQNMRESLAVAESLAKASLLTSPSVERRLRARQLELNSTKDDLAAGYVPPKHVLLYLVRMGSFTSSYSYNNGDHEDNELTLSKSIDRQELLSIFYNEAHNPTPLQRNFLQLSSQSVSNSKIRVMQWNVLSQTLGQNYDKFVSTPEEAMDWKHRRFTMLHEIISYSPDVICLQEVDHFTFLKKTLETQGYDGLFFAKPDSPCLHIKGNNGPDGCAIFYSKDRFDLLKSKKIVLPVWTINSNQVAIATILKEKFSEKTICLTTTHLKARPGALMSSIRKEQGRALLNVIQHFSCGSPIIMCGDFNAGPSEPVYDLIRSSPLDLVSAYAHDGNEPEYTSWKIREDGEHQQTLDYIFYSRSKFQVTAVLKFPNSPEIGETRLPSLNYPSDHLSLVCDLSFK